MSLKETIFISPETGEKLFEYEEDGQHYLATESGHKYDFLSGFLDLVYPKELTERVKEARHLFDNLADDYDRYMPQTFKTHDEDEATVRNGFIDLLNLKPDSKVLEIASGTGRDSEYIAKRLNKDGLFVMSDISPKMLRLCTEKVANAEVPKVFCLCSANHLPFPDNYFDAVYSFTAMQFFDIKNSLAEMARITKPGGKIVVGDHGLPPWLRDTYYCKVLSTNPGILAEVPLKDIPVCARNVTVRWVIGSLFYLIEFAVGEGEPYANFDYNIAGTRGGTLRTRYEGQLEGVTPEAKELAIKAAKAKGMTLHDWLDSNVRQQAKAQLGE